MRRVVVLLHIALSFLLFFPVLALAVLLVKSRKRELIWGPVPIINNRYWSEAMKRAGWHSTTLMETCYDSINKKEDYDLYFEDLVPVLLKIPFFKGSLGKYFAFLYVIRNASIIHIPFSGGPLGRSPLWCVESFLYKFAGIRTVIIPYGADIFRYSQVIDPGLRHGLLLSYPAAARQESAIDRRVRYWTARADVIITGYTIDGLGRWDVLCNMICIDIERWKPKGSYSQHNGLNGTVRVLHAPNHRGVKGTEFLVKAVEDLKSEGMQIELVLMEKVSNDRVREVMQEVDVLVDQLICPGYGLAAIEGMASGIPVLCNLENDAYTRIFRRYSFLNECPIVSSSPELVKGTLRALVTHPEIRSELGRAGRDYVEKYHSYTTAQYLFGSIYSELLDRKSVELLNLFHPLKSEYNRKRPFVRHLLTDNHLPPKYYHAEFSESWGAVRSDIDR